MRTVGKRDLVVQGRDLSIVDEQQHLSRSDRGQDSLELAPPIDLLAATLCRSI